MAAMGAAMKSPEKVHPVAMGRCWIFFDFGDSGTITGFDC